MFLLILAVLSTSTMTILMRYSEQNLHNRYAVTMMNYVASVIVSLLFMGDIPLFIPGSADYTFTLWFGCLNGILFISWFFLYQISISRNGVPVSVIFSRLGVIIPTIGSVIFFNEQPTWLQIAGVIIAVAAIVVYNMPNEKTGQQKLGPVNLLLLLLVFFIGGVGDFDSKIFTMMGNASLGPVFMCYTFILAFVLSFVLWLVKDHSINLQDVIFGMGLGVFNSIATNLLLASLKTLPAFIAYPFYTVSMLVVVNIVNWLLFREKQGKKKIICLVFICGALLLLNI